MPAKEIKELRQAGKLDEAYKMALSELQAEPDNIWSKIPITNPDGDVGFIVLEQPVLLEFRAQMARFHLFAIFQHSFIQKIALQT